MPELPEVETIKRGLQKYLVGCQIRDIEVRQQKLVTGLQDVLKGSTITRVERFGKGLVIELDNDYALAIHIKMTGQLIYEVAKGADEAKVVSMSEKVNGELPNKYTHVIFKLTRKNGGENAFLFYNDIRKFGWIKIIEKSKVQSLKFFKGLGPEPLKDLTLERFKQILQSSKGPIKPLLMDQKKIGGIGNIYANDSLFQAKINPKSKANSLSHSKVKSLFEAIELVLKRGIEYGGASETNFVNALGRDGTYQDHFLVYGQKGKPCKRCGVKIEKIKLGGRGTFYCPHCQAA